jgi:hypothetical protein
MATIGEVDNETWQDAAKEIDKVKNFTNDELHKLADTINNRGLKQLIYWFISTHPGEYLTTDNLHRNATRQWWTVRWSTPDLPMLNFEMEDDGSVIVDLWHTRRGIGVRNSFKDFRSTYPTFFFGSRRLVEDNKDSLEEYVEEAEIGEDTKLYVKRGRFRFTPLLWFGDKNIETLRNNSRKSEVVAKLINTHTAFEERSDFDIRKENNMKWKKMLYYRTEQLFGNKLALEFRLDNNCVEDASVPLAAGFQGTLTVDVSGLAGALSPPGSAIPESESVVIWDVPNTLMSEGPWECLCD